VGRPDLAYQAVLEGLPKLDDARELARAHYVLAMSHARFLPQRNNEMAETFLLEGLHRLGQLPPELEGVAFLTSFLWNGLAYVRHRQGRPSEAIQLCQKAYAHLLASLRPEQHRLHRTVLHYNIAQVYGAAQEYEKAIEHYSAAIQDDPNYSEYYNERGSTFLKLGRLGEAETDYLRAIGLSAPYHEVWTNLGQCYRLQDKLPKAVEAYNVSLDLEPRASLALIGRAQALQGLGRFEEALRDYDCLLAESPDQPTLLSNRAAARWGLGQLDEALADIETALRLDPANSLLQKNKEFLVTAVSQKRNEPAVARYAGQPAAAPP
jgi:tetratricopeptide (TPR) repeat protein